MYKNTMFKRIIAIILAALMVIGVGYTLFQVIVDAEETNLAKGASYSVTRTDGAFSFYGGRNDDDCKKLNDGVVGTGETADSVSYPGTGATFQFLFDLKEVKTGICRIDILSVGNSHIQNGGNRGFDADGLVISCGESGADIKQVESSYEMTHKSSYFYDYSYTIADTKARYVQIVVKNPGYLLSLDEIQIWSNGIEADPEVPVISEEDKTPQFNVVLSSIGTVEQGSEIVIDCAVSGISNENGIVAVDFGLKYDKAAFTPKYILDDEIASNFIKISPKMGSSFRWEDCGSGNIESESKVYVRFADIMGLPTNAVKANGKLAFQVAFICKETASFDRSYTFEATSCYATDPGLMDYSGIHEIYGKGSSTTVSVTERELPPDNILILTDEATSTISIVDGIMTGVAGRTSTEAVKKMFSNKVIVIPSNTVSGVIGTGSFVIAQTATGDNGDSAVIIISGDCNGDGAVDTTDYLRIKNYFLGQFELTGISFKAADIDGDGCIDTTDYSKVKAYFLGLYNLY